jgi:hypothetical protein
MGDYLALLEIKPKHVLKPKTDFTVRIGKYVEEPVKKTEDNEVVDEEEAEEVVVEKKAAVRVVDMRKHPTTNINRDLIRKRIQLGVAEAPVAREPETVAAPEVVPEVTTEVAPEVAPLAPLIKVKKATGKKIVIATGAPVVVAAAPAPAPIAKVKLGKNKLAERLPKPTGKIIHKASSYYMNNRKISIEKLSKLFQPYRQEILDKSDEISCDKSSGVDFELLTHQKAVRDYLNLMTPYRGLLLLHALGSGKTCTSIAIAEGMKTDKQIFVMTPASLSKNFFSQLKDCGDHLYRKNQYWEFVSIVGQPEYEKLLSSALSLSPTYIQKHKGAWLVDVKKPPNFTDLSTSEQNAIDEQLDEMIKYKYKEIHYNAPNIQRIFSELSKDNTVNPFDNTVVLIDEAHNFVSRIVNQIKKPTSISYMLYDYLMKATNVKIVMMTGTPIINYPNEIGILFNMLRGAIKTWTFQLRIKDTVTTETILQMFANANFNTYDYIAYNNGTLTITRNPYGFVNVQKPGKTGKIADGYAGVRLDETGNISDMDFQRMVVRILNNDKTEVVDSATKVTINKALPDDKDSFLGMFVDTDAEIIKNNDLFTRRVLGLTSFLPNTQDSLLPSLIKWEDANGDEHDYEEVKVEMSDYQFSAYEKIREIERNKETARQRNEKKAKKGDDLFKTTSSYRIRSRACCNFAFPDPPGRPMPFVKKTGDEDDDDEDEEKLARMMGGKPGDEDVLDDEEGGVNDEAGESSADDNKLARMIGGTPTEEDVLDDEGGVNNEGDSSPAEYSERIQIALQYLSDRPDEFLVPEKLKEFSPKFEKILENISDPTNVGLHLLYSQFRTVEGIGLMKIILEANGYAQFKIHKKSANEWSIDQREEDKAKPKFMLYTGTESEEEKDILLKIYNSQWEYVPSSITQSFEGVAENNHMGEVIKIIMITSSGAEGINLKNTRFVHIVEPYWHMVRVDQVIGRARRICSHSKLPEELRTVKVFLYLATFNMEKLKASGNKTLMEKDVSKVSSKPVTTDESLFETAGIKNKINQQLLTYVKQSAFDCSTYAGIGNNKLKCYTYGSIKSNAFSSHPSIEEDLHVKPELDTKEVKVKVKQITVGKKKYAYNEAKNEIYAMENYEAAKANNAALLPVGRFNEKTKQIEWYKM